MFKKIINWLRNLYEATEDFFYEVIQTSKDIFVHKNNKFYINDELVSDIIFYQRLNDKLRRPNPNRWLENPESYVPERRIKNSREILKPNEWDKIVESFLSVSQLIKNEDITYDSEGAVYLAQVSSLFKPEQVMIDYDSLNQELVISLNQYFERRISICCKGIEPLTMNNNVLEVRLKSNKPIITHKFND